MRSPARLDRVHRLRTRLRELADREAARRATRVSAVERDLAATRAAEDAARSVGPGTAGSAIALAWAHADALARRAGDLLAERERAVASAEAAGDAVRERRREEERFARLAARARVHLQDETARDGARALDALALWSHGRKR
jgi:hypothetical protein